MKGLLYSKPAILVLVIMGIFLSMSVYERFQSEREMAAKTKAAGAELAELKIQAAALEAKVEHLQSERGIEEELRDRFEVARSGEQVFVLLGKEETEASSSKRTPITGGERTFFDAVKDFFWQ